MNKIIKIIGIPLIISAITVCIYAVIASKKMQPMLQLNAFVDGAKLYVPPSFYNDPVFWRIFLMHWGWVLVPSLITAIIIYKLSRNSKAF